MKKLIIILSLIFCVGFSVFSEDGKCIIEEVYETVDKDVDSSTDFEFTWCFYEIKCYSNGKEPSYDEYIELCENPQCFEL